MIHISNQSSYCSSFLIDYTGTVAGNKLGALPYTSRLILAISNDLLTKNTFTGMENNDIMIEWIRFKHRKNPHK